MEQRKFLAMVGPLAQADMQKSGILASLTIAQAILESGWGTSELAAKANALFGIKADARWSGRAYSKDTKECYDGVTYATITALFRAYDSWAESVADHSAFLLANKRYAAVVGERDYKVACKAISTVYGWVDAAAITGKASATPAAKTYTVKAGDSLWRIAAQQLGNGARYKEIKTLNGLKNNTIHAGQVLKLPN